MENLFFAGRNISATHMAMSSTRVMATCGLFGEAVGKAAAIVTKNSLTPHEVYLQKIPQVQELLMKEGCFLPSKTRTISEVCKKANLSGANDEIRNGQDRLHERYFNAKKESNKASEMCPIKYSFEETEIGFVHLTFDSDINRRTLDGSWIEQRRSMRANHRLDSPQLHMPRTLCKEFELIGKRRGESVCLLQVKENRKRDYHLSINSSFDELILIPKITWGGDKEVPVISFDFS